MTDQAPLSMHRRSPSYRLSLKLLIPLILGFCFFLLIGLSAFLQMEHMQSDLMREEKQHINIQLVHLREVVEHEYPEDRGVHLHDLLGKYAHDEGLVTLGVLKNYEVLFSTRLEWFGKRIEEVDSGFSRDLAEEAIASSRPLLISNREEQIYAYFPVPLRREEAGQSTVSQGVIFLHSNAHEDIERGLREQWEILFIGVLAPMLVAFILLWWMLKKFVTRRAERIRLAAEAMLQGNYSVRSRVHGQDELGEIGEAFDRLAEYLRESTAQLRRDRARTEAILRTAVDAVITIDDRGVIQTFNESASQMFGYSEAEAVGRNVSILMPESYAREHDGYLRNYMQTQQGKIIGIGREVPCRRRDGSEFMGDMVVSEVKIDDEVVFTGMIRDVTERHQFEQDLLLAREAAMQGMRIKNDFLANINHEFRTPMNGIMGCMSLLRDTTLSDEQRAYIDTAEDSAQRLMSLLSGIIDLVRMDEGALMLKLEVFSPYELVQEVLVTYRQRARDKGLDLTGVLMITPDALIRTDREKLEKVLSNLLANAIKFTEQGEIKLLVETVTTPMRQRLRFTVVDTGIGVPKEAQAGIFERFSQFDTSSTRQFQGMGIGLAVCKQIVTLMNGEIGYEPNPESGGSHFWFYIPYEPVHEMT